MVARPGRFDSALIRPPVKINRDVKRLFRLMEIQPRAFRVTVDPTYPPSDCFNNVQRHVSAHGGELVLGWAIWENPTHWVEAEYHAIWKKGESYFDVTRHSDDELEILFLPDPKAGFLPDLTTRVPNVMLEYGASDIQKFIYDIAVPKETLYVEISGRNLTPHYSWPE